METHHLDRIDKLPVLTAGPGGTVRHEFKAFLPDQLLGPKVDAFITDQAAKVIQVTRDQVQMRIGDNGGLVAGEIQNVHPVDVTIHFHRNPDRTDSLVDVVADLRLRSRGLPKNAMQERYLDVVRALRACLMAHEDEPNIADFSHEPSRPFPKAL